MSARPPVTERGTEQKRIASPLPTPEHNVPGITDLSTLRPGDLIAVEGHAEPLTVQFVGVREISTVDGVTKQYAIEATHDRGYAVAHEFYESINLADGSVIEIVDANGRPLRVYEVVL